MHDFLFLFVVTFFEVVISNNQIQRLRLNLWSQVVWSQKCHVDIKILNINTLLWLQLS